MAPIFTLQEWTAPPKDLIGATTPIETYDVAGVPVSVKRDDLAFPPPAPPLAKLRGIGPLLYRLQTHNSVQRVATMDTRVSRTGWGVAYMAKKLGMQCSVYYPQLKSDDGVIPPNQAAAAAYGATIIPLKAGRSTILYYWARAMARKAGVYMLPWAMVCEETFETIRNEMYLTPTERYQRGSIVVCVGSGTILCGVAAGLRARVSRIVGVMSGMTSQHEATFGTFLQGLPVQDQIELVPSGLEYKEPEPLQSPFPTHPNYDAKAWRYLVEHIGELPQPIFFYNIGA